MYKHVSFDEKTPTLVIAPGFWESSTGVFDETVARLQERGWEVIVAQLYSTGRPSSDAATLNDDIAAVRRFIEPVVSRGRDVVVAAHSAGGFISSAAVEGLTKRCMVRSGHPGGVVGFAFICAGLFPLGHVTGPMPFFEIRGEYTHPANPRVSLFNDIDDQDAQIWIEKLRPQPAANWDAQILFTGHDELPCNYLVCAKDHIIPVQLQLDFAALAQADIMTCDAGHMVMLSDVDVLLFGKVKQILQY
ncbi:Alpha/Beta hydrolase protein [Pyrenochaeta sp. MPI-SDFR-AT-0127]|nr:Alpha/Beta hydrolase protein [Pyrenochaeta sp. MPI-SDFR-AT-0127]